MIIGKNIKNGIRKRLERGENITCKNCEVFLGTHIKTWCQFFKEREEIPIDDTVQHKLSDTETMVVLCKFFEADNA